MLPVPVVVTRVRGYRAEEGASGHRPPTPTNVLYPLSAVQWQT